MCNRQILPSFSFLSIHPVLVNRYKRGCYKKCTLSLNRVFFSDNEMNVIDRFRSNPRINGVKKWKAKTSVRYEKENDVSGKIFLSPFFSGTSEVNVGGPGNRRFHELFGGKFSQTTMTSSFRLSSIILFAAVLWEVAGCAVVQERSRGSTDLRTRMTRKVRVNVALPPEGNAKTAVAVDFLTVHDKALAELLMETDAKTWFTTKNQIKNDFTAGEAFDLEEREYAPGSVVPVIALPWRNRKTVLFIFADYQAPGVHRYRATKREELQLSLGEKEFEVKNSISKRAGGVGGTPP